MKITNGENVRFPKWSIDGNWIAYIRASKVDEFPLHEGDLWLYNVKSKKNHRNDQSYL
jgi:Tol biopolymer transport system component